MAQLNIRTEHDPALRKKSRPVTEITQRIRTLLDDMLETMRAADGVGLAAPQARRTAPNCRHRSLAGRGSGAH